MTHPIPEGFHTVTPHLIIKGAARAIEFYKQAFGAEEVCLLNGPGGSVMHAQIKIGDSVLMIADEWPGCEESPKAPTTLGGTSVVMHVYVGDADAAFAQAVNAGATPTMPPMDTFWGDRYGTVRDPYGHGWSIATKVKDLTVEEIEQGAQEFLKQMGQGGCGEG